MNHNLLDVINQVIAHFSKPGSQFGVERFGSRTCVYRTVDGDMCAIGCVIGPELAEKLSCIPVETDDGPNRYIDIWTLSKSIESMYWDKKWKEFLTEMVHGLGCEMKDLGGLVELQTLHDFMSTHYTTKDFVKALEDAIKNQPSSIETDPLCHRSLRQAIHG